MSHLQPILAAQILRLLLDGEEFADPSGSEATSPRRRLLDCIPGRADQPGTGEPIAIITMSHKGEIQPPMMLVERDIKKLAVCLLNVLAHHDEPKAKEIMAKYFTHDEEDDGD